MSTIWMKQFLFLVMLHGQCTNSLLSTYPASSFSPSVRSFSHPSNTATLCKALKADWEGSWHICWQTSLRKERRRWYLVALSCSSGNCYSRDNYGLPDCDRWRIPSWAFSNSVARCSSSSVTGLREGRLDCAGSSLSSCNADWIVFVFIRISAAVW